MEQKAAKDKIAKLVEKYKQLSPAAIKGYSEEETKKGFIEPLFKALGWDFTHKEEVSAEEHIKSSGLADYGFYINGRAKFYLEAKSLKADLYKEEYARQAIRYSFNKVVTWAVLTDFKNLKIFNANAISDNLGDKQYLSIAYTEYLDRFDELWLLSREAFEKDLIDVEATRAGKMLQKVSVTDKLYEDLNKCRILLTKSLTDWNKQVPKELIDEGVQKLLDRLIFMRVAEDRKVEPHMLKELIRSWNNRDKKDRDVTLYQSMTEKFRELDAIYNSNLFSKHPFEGWEEHNEVTEKVINILYGKEGYYEYDFKFIPADVLGNIYENYLGYQLQQSEKGLTTSKDAKKRKEQGIYYTPTYIVDYIVGNALKPVLDKCDSIADLKQIKVLDPACGSGSFLLRAMEVIAEKYVELGRENDELVKIEILTQNIYGVDLDEKAVEIARLNLLINSLDKRMKLPNLAKNIKNGNSIISGTDQELKAAFGNAYRDKKPFNWQEEFPEVFSRDNPGFDVIIGNPPYLSIERGLLEDLDYLKSKFSTIEKIYDIFGLFLEQSLNFLRNEGHFGFIIPSIFLTNDSFSKLRQKILGESVIRNLNLYQDGVFKGAVVPTCVIVSEKVSPDNDYEISANIYKEAELIKSPALKASTFKDDQFYRFNLSADDESLKFIEKVSKDSIPLSSVLKIQEALKTGDDKKFISESPFKGPNNRVLLKGSDVDRYAITGEHYINYDQALLKRPGKVEVFESEKLYIRRIGNKVIAAFDDKGRYAVHTLYTGILLDKSYEMYYLLGLLNSSLFTYLYRSLFPFKGNIFPEIRIGSLGTLPVKKLNKNEQTPIAVLVRKIVKLNQDLSNEMKGSNKWHSIKSEIEKTDHQIDQFIYKLYSLTPEEIKMIESQ
jgi:adenine-specific DNA-methyltransferase